MTLAFAGRLRHNLPMRRFILLAIAPVLAAFCFAQKAGDAFTIVVQPPTSAKNVQVRYFITGEFGGYASESTANPSANRILISTSYEGKAATKLAAVAFAPGCQFVTIAVDELATGSREGAFQCEKLATVPFHGRIGMRSATTDARVEVLYDPIWAMEFFGIRDGAVSPFAVGQASIAADGSFALDLPDFLADPLWSQRTDASLRFVLVRGNGARRNGLLPGAGYSQNGSLKIEQVYPAEVPFTVQQ